MKDKKNTSRTGEQDESQPEEKTCFICSECGESFEKPLLTSISSQGLVQSYYACPHCLGRIPENEEAETSTDEPSVGQKESGGEQPKPQNEKCQHFLGYLKKRSKETAIPEDCLTCQKIIECMTNN